MATLSKEVTMNLDLYLRTHVVTKIRPIYIKSECEHCGSTSDLHLHHVKPFVKMVDKVLNKLGLELKDSDAYTDQERYLIVSCVLSEHLNGEYLTLCPSCHYNVHEGNKKRRASLSEEQKQRLKQIRLEQKEKLKQQKLDELNQQRKELLEQHLNVKLNNEQFKNLTEKLNFKRNRQLIKNPIDEIKQLGYDVENKRTKTTRYKIITKTTLDKSQVS